MKKNVGFSVLLICLLALGFVFVACDNGSGLTGEENSLTEEVGTITVTTERIGTDELFVALYDGDTKLDGIEALNVGTPVTFTNCPTGITLTVWGKNTDSITIYHYQEVTLTSGETKDLTYPGFGGNGFTFVLSGNTEYPVPSSFKD